MLIDIVESKTTGANSEVYKKLAEWVDRELSKLVLGQTASAEGTAGKLGDSKIQEEVRDDITKADALQFEQTVNRDLVIPYVNFNFGEQQVYPQIKTKLVEKKNVELIVNSVQKLVPLGLKVSKAEMLNLLGLSSPADNEEVLEQRSPAGPEHFGLNSQVSLNNTAPDPAMLFTAEPGDSQDEEDGYIAISDEIVAVLEKAMDKSTDFKSFQKELAKLAADWPPDKIAEYIAVATFKARVQGHLEFDK
jgi:phage gp29-like protein